MKKFIKNNKQFATKKLSINITIKMLFVFLISFLFIFNLFTNNKAYGAIRDDKDFTKDALPEGAKQVSRFETPTGKGYYEIDNPFTNKNDELKSNKITFYKASIIQTKKKEYYTLYLYFLTNDDYDKEIEKEMEKKKNILDGKINEKLLTIPGFYDGKTME